ncbi:glycosyltransferase [Pseudodesulfovibrio cashew]|uniref:Glycosyltransferase n=1 Tax=Pseudodesulfovibrio cashew TaxID=2678688 RepID=A0A6I6JFD4_9BACT|nr:glycosyltransferase family 4 protein [Pseudodesulfovibrio cashew]QGY40891.1 glycosyltransferase [Pseudodesulfovibrio cashew]
MTQSIHSVAMMTNLFPPLATGSSIHSSTLANKLVERGVAVTVFTAHVSKDAPEHENMDGIDVYRLPCFKFPKLPIAVNFPWISMTMFPKNISFMRKKLRENNCQLIHVHNHMFDMALNGAYLANRLKLPLALTIHSIIRHPNPFYNGVLGAIDATFLRYCMVSKADAVVDLDNSCTRYLASRFGREDGTLIPLAIDLPQQPSAADVDALRDKYQLHGKKVILSVGHLHHLRNRLSLIRGFAKVLRTHPESRLIIIGARNYQPTLDLVAELGLEKEVIFTGKQPHHLIPAFLKLCDLHSMWFDLDPEGRNSLANANIEAMFMGKPVMGMLDINAYGKGVLKDWENIVIIPHKDPEQHIAKALVKLFDNPELAETIGKNSQDLAQKTFNWDLVTDRHLALYSSLAGKEAQ